MAELIETGHTTLLANKTASVSSARYFADKEPIFAFPKYGNRCTSYITGREYMAAVAQALRSAQKFIFIADWQLDYDVELDQRGTPGHKGRLTEILADALERGVHVRVMLYDSFSEVLDTHDDAAQKLLSDLPKGKGSIEVMLQNSNTGRRPDVGILFSHHQKFLVVDGHLAFVGGIDLAYGRWETPNFDVVIDPALHVLNDAYSEQLDGARYMTQGERKLTERDGKRPGFRAPIRERLLDPAFQPRQPWEDVAVAVEGPAVFDVFKNFVRRWNSFSGISTNALNNPLSAAWFKNIGGESTLVDPRKRGAGAQSVQICRSVSAKQGRHEFNTLNVAYGPFGASTALDTFDDWKSKDADNRNIWKTALARAAGKSTTGILQSMCNCIMAAESFVYIENQFFITECGKDRFGKPNPPHNPIGHTLATKIAQAIHAGQPFHAYLVIPEHPEGQLNKPGTVSQAYWAQQSIKHGTDSLISRIQQALLEAKPVRPGQVAFAAPRWSPAKLAKAIKDDPETAGRWTEYLTVLHMRNFGATKQLNSAGQLEAEYLLTEMIYVHSKLLIVDDAVAIIGSANINDRSLMGNGDTELAAVIVDENSQIRDMGQGVKAVTRQFARDLRISLWKKHLGMTIEGKPYGAEKQTAPPYGINLEQPLAVKTIDGIKQVANGNAKAYETVFTHTLRNSTPTMESIESFFPNGLAGPPPMLQSAYMKKLSEADAQRRRQNSRYDPRGTTAYRKYEQGNKAMLSNEIAIQDTYFRGSEYWVHDVQQGLDFLKKNVKGYWTLAPLDWGMQYSKTPDAPGGDRDVTIARNDVNGNNHKSV